MHLLYIPPTSTNWLLLKSGLFRPTNMQIAFTTDGLRISAWFEKPGEAMHAAIRLGGKAQSWGDAPRRS